MAKIGMRYPVAAKITGYGADGYPTYDQGIIIGRGVKASISYDTADAELYADDGLAESDASVVGYSGSLEVDGFGTHQSAKSEAVATIMQYLYNLDTSEDNSFEITDAMPPNLGMGYIRQVVKRHTKTYTVIWCHEVQFKNPADEDATKEKGVTFNTSTIEFTGHGVEVTPKSGDSRQVFVKQFTGFETLKAAKTKLYELAKIKETTGEV